MPASTSLPTRRLGASDLEITTVGFGAWAIGGADWAIRRECDASLRRLGVGRIDLYQFHTPADDGTPVEDSWATMLELVAERHGVTPAAVAIAWTLAWPGVTGAIVGARSPEQVDGWIAAAGVRLTDDDLDELAAAIERTGAGHGPTRPAR